MASMADIKALRQQTGAGILDCKKALEATDSVEEAIDWLRAKGISKAAKKSTRAATEGLVHSYIHGNGRVGVMICLLYTSPSPRDQRGSRMPSSA